MHHDEAYRCIHFPSSPEEAEKALRTLAFTELLLMELSVLRERPSSARRTPSKPSRKELQLLQSLPFTLTEDQMKAADEIREDMDGGVPIKSPVAGIYLCRGVRQAFFRRQDVPGGVRRSAHILPGGRTSGLAGALCTAGA